MPLYFCQHFPNQRCIGAHQPCGRAQQKALMEYFRKAYGPSPSKIPMMQTSENGRDVGSGVETNILLINSE